MCGALAREVIAIRDRYQWSAQILAIPASLHNAPCKIPDAVADRVENIHEAYEHIVIVYGDCGTGGILDRTLDKLGLERIAGPHCYEQYAGSEMFDRLMDEEPGTFFLTGYLVQSFDHLVIEDLGLDRYPELRDDYFRHYKRIVYLQQTANEQLLMKAEAAATYLNLPLEIVPTGYGALEDRLREFVDRHSVVADERK